MSGGRKSEKRCGECCWFCYEDTDGWGQCMQQDVCDCMHCSDLCTKDEFVSREKMRHYQALMLQHNRWRRDDNVPNSHKKVNPKELGEAIDFACKYMKTFSKL